MPLVLAANVLMLGDKEVWTIIDLSSFLIGESIRSTIVGGIEWLTVSIPTSKGSKIASWGRREGGQSALSWERKEAFLHLLKVYKLDLTRRK